MEDPIVALTKKLETLIDKVISIESITALFAEFVQKLESMTVTLDTTHDLVNSRMTQLTQALERVAALESALAGEAGEERGVAKERERAQAEGEPPGNGG